LTMKIEGLFKVEPASDRFDFLWPLKSIAGAGRAWTVEERTGDYQDEFREIWVQATRFRSVML